MRTIFLIVFLWAFLGNAYSQVVTGDVGMRRQHSDWASFLLNVGGITEPRAVSRSLENFGSLFLDFSPPDCSVSLGFIIPLGEPVKTDNFRDDLILSFRADRKTRYDLPAMSSVTMGDTSAVVLLNVTPQFNLMIEDMKNGLSLRSKIMFGNDESSAIYTTYSLLGFTAAFYRAKELCEKGAGINRSPNYVDRL